MRKAFRHTGVLMMVAVVALGLLGAAYTLWYEKLTVETTITTGTLDANWSLHNWNGSSFDSATSTTANGQPVVHVATEAETLLNGGVATVLSGGLLGGKTTAASYGLFLQSNFPDGKPKPTCTATGGDSNTLTFTMGGLYPYAGCEFQMDLHSEGSVPFHIAITDSKIEQLNAGGNPNNPGDWTTVTGDGPWSRGFPSTGGTGTYTPGSNESKCFSFFNADWKGPMPGQITDGNVVGGTPIQIHTGQDLVCNFKLILDENWWDGSGYTPADYSSNQGLTFRITAKYVAYQWNENPSSTLLQTLP